ncbi:methyl-accepting chemotaxis protein [Paenibacillus sp. 22594]|uniref:methyl-accepting chemotaxis protein n=1 Tax=Paenibacillus sp. 22594 TaxID=3453947 RepID=UPI003F82A364
MEKKSYLINSRKKLVLGWAGLGAIFLFLSWMGFREAGPEAQAAVIAAAAAAAAMIGYMARRIQEQTSKSEELSVRIQGLTADLEKIAQSAAQDSLESRMDVSRYDGEIRACAEQMNRVLELFHEKIYWLEAITDAVPFPIHVTDEDMKWTFMNKPFEKLMIEQGVLKERKDGYGKDCSNADANICNTANCGIKQLQKGRNESFFDWCGMNCKQDTSFLRNRKGEVIGYVEVVTDLTSILRVNEYTKSEVDRLATNLDQLARGDFNLNLEVSEADEYTRSAHDNFVKINRNLEKTKEAVGRLLTDVSMLSEAAVQGNLDIRANATHHDGQYSKIVEGVNQTLDTAHERNAWYEAIIDAVPLPIHVTDSDMNWTYMNKDFEKLMIEQGVVKDRKSGYGKACSNAGANICNTSNCGINQLQKGKSNSYFDWCGMNCKQDTSFLRNKKGEVIGYVEVVTDLTPILRNNEYMRNEIKRLATNLELLAKGNLNLDFRLGEADQHTAETHKNFYTINGNLEKAKEAISRMIKDILTLSDAAIEGKLDTRIDSSDHDGEFKKIIEGVNHTLHSVIEPIQESAAVLEEMSKGNLNVSVKGNYKGDHAKIKLALNDTISILSSYVSEITGTLTEMTSGNLMVEIHSEYRGDFEEIKHSLNHIIQSFNDTLNDINTAAIQVSSGAALVSDSAQSLSHASTQQASAVEELTSSLEQISAQTRQNAQNANQANEMALIAKEDAVNGNDRMKEMLNAMNEINEASSNIAKIIKVIDEIAFQTNILALNAAVEAARAGQHGKGFAVVAEEVRNLAARSANAAKETTVLIEGSIKKAEDGTKIASETAGALNTIVEVVSKAANLVGEITVASNEQALGIAQINQGIQQVSQVVQNNSASSEESAAASEELSSQAELLNSLVSKFKLKKADSDYRHVVEGISPEVLRMLQEMNGGKLAAVGAMRRPKQDTSARPVITLGGRDFGKY